MTRQSNRRKKRHVRRMKPGSVEAQLRAKYGEQAYQELRKALLRAASTS